MALMNATREEQTAQAERELQEKLALEASAIVVFNRIFRDISAALVVSYAANQQGPDLLPFDQQIREELQRHNDEVAAVFGSKIIDFINKDGVSESQIDQAIDQIALENGTNRADVINNIAIQNLLATSLLLNTITNANSSFIANTNASSVQDAIETAEQAGLSAENPLSIREIGELAASLFLAEGLVRSPTISATTTQQVAEGVKETELEAVQNVISSAAIIGVVVAALIEPAWVTVGDNKVRIAHAEADGQRRGAEGFPGAFLVGGEVLRYPGDPNGSSENTINCRCSLVFIAL